MTKMTERFAIRPIGFFSAAGTDVTDEYQSADYADYLPGWDRPFDSAAEAHAYLESHHAGPDADGVTAQFEVVPAQQGEDFLVDNSPEE